MENLNQLKPLDSLPASIVCVYLILIEVHFTFFLKKKILYWLKYKSSGVGAFMIMPREASYAVPPTPPSPKLLLHIKKSTFHFKGLHLCPILSEDRKYLWQLIDLENPNIPLHKFI